MTLPKIFIDSTAKPSHVFKLFHSLNQRTRESAARGWSLWRIYLTLSHHEQGRRPNFPRSHIKAVVPTSCDEAMYGTRWLANCPTPALFANSKQYAYLPKKIPCSEEASQKAKLFKNPFELQMLFSPVEKWWQNKLPVADLRFVVSSVT